MKRLSLALLFLAAGSLRGATLTGAGATFPYPLYARWAYAYEQATGTRINYQSIGSGGGIRQIMNRTVDFGASDAPLTPEETRKARLAQFPTVVGGVVIAFHLPLPQLRLSSKAVCGIFLGTVQRWNDPVIQEANPGVNLPDQKITVIHRSDGSGTTWIFTHYLSRACPEWENKVGYGKAVNWPTGIGAKGNEGVANYLKRLRGAIGYVEYAYARQNRLTVAAIENRDGAFVAPSLETFQAAAAHARWSPDQDFYEVLTWQPGKDAYPITGATFILMARDYPPERNRKIVDFFRWAFEHGDSLAVSLDYVPLPKKVKTAIQAYWKQLGWLP